MTVVAFLPLLVALIGLVVYFVCTGKREQAGLVAWGCGLLAFLLAVGGKTISFGF